MDWTNYKVINPQRIDKKPIIDNTEENYIGNNKNNHHKNEINFNDDPARIKAWEQWIYKRNKWLNNYGPLKEAFQLYSTLFSWRSTIKKEGYSKGCFLCNGFVRSEDGKINYPLLLQHVHIELDSSNEQAILSVKIVNDSPIRIASDVLHQTEDEFNLQALNDLANINDKFSFDLMDPDSFGPHIARLANNLSEKCIWQNVYNKNAYNRTTKFIFFNKPILFLTNIPNGTKDTVEKIIQFIDEDKGASIPLPLKHLLCGYQENEHINIPKEKETTANRIAVVGGESEDTLLSLPANQDQLEIARKVKFSDAVLVQGPPGTGKTHSIANILGDMLANGQRVLVTSKTDKALSVLNDKLPKAIQPLCLTLLENEAGSSLENIKLSVESICLKTSQNDYSCEVLEKQESEQKHQRDIVIKRLEAIRQQLYEVRNAEITSIPFQGEAHTLSGWAKWLRENQESSSILPDQVSLESLSLKIDELKELYDTNDKISPKDEYAMNGWIPEPDLCPTADAIQKLHINKQAIDKRIPTNNITLLDSFDQRFLRIYIENTIFKFKRKELDNVIEFIKNNIEAFNNSCPKWIRNIQIDGIPTIKKKLTDCNGIYIEENKTTEISEITEWDRFINQTNKFIEACSERYHDSDRPDVILPHNIDLNELKLAIKWFLVKAPTGQISKFRFFIKNKFNKNKSLISGVKVSDQAPSSSFAFRAVLNEINWQLCLRSISNLWNKLIKTPKFSSLGNHPERELPKYITRIKNALSWWKLYGQEVYNKIGYAVMDSYLHNFFEINDLSTNSELRDAILEKVNKIIIPISQYLDLIQERDQIYKCQSEYEKYFIPPLNTSLAPITTKLRNSILDWNSDDYHEVLQNFLRLSKLHDIAKRRNILIKELAKSAPKWAEFIKQRKSGWNQSSVPDNVFSALRWHSINNMVKSRNSIDYEKLQHESQALSNEFRNLSSNLAATRAWLHMARRLDNNPNIRQSLNGWMTIVNKIGKGTGKRAQILQVEARKYAANCQTAIPIWVMTTQRALTTLDPREKFDVIIVDEASQSDLTSLALLFMGKRIIVVGDDQQVSPSGVGIPIEQINSMRNEFLDGNVKNSLIYDETSSLYDIIKSISNPIMLREHFRCAPDIISYSNWLSYNGQIIPLRDMSRCPITPHMVPYRVLGKRTSQDTNIEEALAIVAIIQSCIEQPEYEGKTFGVISMFSGQGQSQVALIDRLLQKELPTKVYEERHISVGISADFQGDERDVILLSLVNSPNEPGQPLRLEGYGKNDSTKKRFNVAVSRARDQIWIVHSFDPNTELKSDDIRYGLLKHANNPEYMDMKQQAIATRTESPFEKDVAQKLTSRGYDLYPQYAVGRYRLDFVVRDGDNAVALECDGEKYHSSAEKIVEDMERQAILERNGWRFIRVRGSEYYSNPEAAIDRICNELSALGVNASHMNTDNNPTSNELITRIKMRVSEILSNNAPSKSGVIVND